MTESFAQLFKESLTTIKTKPGSIIPGTIVAIDKDIVLVDAGLKSESSIPIEQFLNSKGKLEIKIGDKIDVALDAIEDGFGETMLSREKAKRHESWIVLEQAYKELSTITGVINGKVKGGFTVEINDIRAFLPGSLVDVRPTRETIHLEGKELEFKVIKLDQKRNNVVVSRKAVIESENNAERRLLLKSLKEGLDLKGMVKNLTDYGAFIDLGGVDGLLHITDMAWKRVKHPSEIVSIGDEITVKILKYDQDKTRVSLGLKQLGIDPWINISNRYPEGSKFEGKVTNLTDYGCFVEIEEGVEGLVHVSEMDWTNKNIHPTKVVALNDQVNVMILNIDEERRRISLGLKQCMINPWKKFSDTYTKGNNVEGKIKSITDFGIFIGLPGGIDGLVHLSDISWTISGEEAVKGYKKGEKISAVVLQVDSDRERISLGIKQLEEDPFNVFVSIHKKGSIVTGKIIKKDTNEVIVNLTKIINGIIKITDLKFLNQIDIVDSLKIGDDIKTKINSIDKKNRIIYLSLFVKKVELNNKKVFLKKNKTIDNQNNSNVMLEAFKVAKTSE